MPAPLDVDREAVKTLAIAVGVREAARQMGINESAVQQWSARGRWFAKPELPPHLAKQHLTNVTKPGQALLNTMQDRLATTKLNLSRYLVNGSKVAAKSRQPLRDAPNVKALAGVLQAVYPEQQAQGTTINVLNATGGMG